MDTMNLNESSDGMVPLDLPTPQKPPEKNIPKQQMDSTPISDIMPSAPIDQDGMMYAQAPQPQMQMQQQQAYQQAPMMQKQNPMNLTDDQYQALVAGVAAIIAFCKPVQEKLVSFFPQLMVEGNLSTAGLIVSGLIAAVLYYLAQRFVINR
jgi:hypothetical protein